MSLSSDCLDRKHINLNVKIFILTLSQAARKGWGTLQKCNWKYSGSNQNNGVSNAAIN